MSDKSDGSELIKDKAFQNLLEKMDADADAAEQKWKSQVANRAFADFPPNFLVQYKTDGAQLDKTSGNFNLEWNKVVAGRGDAKKLLAAYDAYSGSLEALWESNARFEALIEVDVAAKVGVLLMVLLEFSKRSLIFQLEKELKALQVELEKAEDEVSDVEWKRRLNVVASAITFVLFPETALARAAVIAGGITSHVIIDNALGHGTAKGTAVFVAGDGAEAIEKLGEGGKKFFGAAAAVVTYKFDSDELAEVKEVVDRLRARIESVRKLYDDLMAGLLPLVPKLRALDGTIKRLVQEIKKAMTRSSDAAKNYDAIKKSIKKTL